MLYISGIPGSMVPSVHSISIGLITSIKQSNSTFKPYVLEMLITAIFILCFMSAVTAIPCKDVNLQSDVDYTKVKGEWWQARHSHESRYSEFSCFDTRIFGVNTEHKLFYMQEVASETRPRIGTVQLLLMSTMCWGSCVSEREYSCL
uniref:uncharacterized protein LOC120334512 n=1 Tax=Styela clava TaxID=7725 RepID=UPI001939C145|nr:uncharacterized protein LOC120334512 [Styela clava]